MSPGGSGQMKLGADDRSSLPSCASSSRMSATSRSSLSSSPSSSSGLLGRFTIVRTFFQFFFAALSPGGGTGRALG